MKTISFTVGIGIRGPIEPGEYLVRNYHLQVSYPAVVNLGYNSCEMPKSLSTVFVVSWEDHDESTAKLLQSKTYERHLPIYDVLNVISELLQAYKLVRIGHADARGLRTIGLYDTLFFYPSINGKHIGDLNVGLKNLAGNNAWPTASPSADPLDTTQLARPHIGKSSLPLARRYVRCYELLEHGFYSEAFIVAFSVLDDFVQQGLHDLLNSKGLKAETERNELLRGIKENRLKLYLGPLLRLVSGQDIEALWPESKAALKWLNNTRNRIAHQAENIDYATAAKGIFVCLKLLVILNKNGVMRAEINIELFRNAKITAAWTSNPQKWIPSGELAESMDFRS